MKEKYLFLTIYLIIKLSSQQENNYCDLEHSCSNCTYFGENDNNYCSCNFYNGYCYNEESSSYYDFNSNFLINYDGCLSNSGNMQNICGESNIIVGKNQTKTINFKSTSSINFLCYYNIQFPENNSNQTTIEIIPEGENHSEFNLYYIVYRNNNKRVTKLSDTIIKNNYLEITEQNFQKISFYIDIKNPQNLEEFSVIITNKDKIQNQETTFPTTTNEINRTSKSSGSSKTGLIVGLILGGIALIIGIIVTVILVRNRMAKKNDSIINTNQSSIIDTKQNNYSEYFNIVNTNRTKMENLFKTELLPKTYIKNNINNDCYNCTICMEDFVENSSKVITTKCGHTFHQKCFQEWTYRNIICPKCPNCNYLILGPESEINLESISIPPTISGFSYQGGINNTTVGMTH